MAQSEMLTKFYNAYNDWVEAGAPEYPPTFRRANGLCDASYEWARRDARIDIDAAFAVCRQIMTQFTEAGLNRGYPFSTKDEYNDRQANNSQHLCPVRMAWVKAHLEG